MKKDFIMNHARQLMVASNNLQQHVRNDKWTDVLRTMAEVEMRLQVIKREVPAAKREHDAAKIKKQFQKKEDGEAL